MNLYRDVAFLESHLFPIPTGSKVIRCTHSLRERIHKNLMPYLLPVTQKVHTATHLLLLKSKLSHQGFSTSLLSVSKGKQTELFPRIIKPRAA